MTRRRTAAVLLVTALTLAACSDSSSTTADTTAAPTTTVPGSEPGSVPGSVPGSSDTTVAETTTPPASTSAPTTEGEGGYDFSAVGPIVQEFVDENGLNGAGLIVVDRNDGVIHHEHWGEFGPDRISLVASSSKMIVAGVLMRLHDDGLLDVDAPVADVAEWGDANPSITPAQLVSNSSGLVGLLPDPAYGPYLCQWLAAGTIQDCAESIFTTEADDGDIAAPDSEFRYGGAQWQVAGAVAEIASGRSWNELIDEIYVEPCGLDALGFNNHTTQLASAGFSYPTDFDSNPSQLAPTDNPNMEGGAYVTTGDYGELLLMHLRDGMCGDTQVLSVESLDRMHSDRLADAYGGDAWSPNTGYGMGWWIDRTTGRISDGGAYGSVPWLDLEDAYGAFLVIEASSQQGNQLADLLYDVIEDAVHAGRS